MEIENELSLSFKNERKIKISERVIDCDADPFVPSGWQIEEHQKGGVIKFDASKIEFYFFKKQKGGNIERNKLCEDMKEMKVLNANVLDHFLINQHLIPEEWKGKNIFFWGTIYCYLGSDLVRYLCWNDGQWCWSSRWVGDLDSTDPSAFVS